MWEYKNFEEKMTPYIDNIYVDVFGVKKDNIIRSKRDNYQDDRALILDKDFGVDTVLTLNNGTNITIQEKTRKFYYSKYNDFTFEYYNDPRIKDPGEWFKLAAQLYFFGYANQDENGYYKYWLIDIFRLRLMLNQCYTLEQLESRFLQRNRPPAKANFFGIPFYILENAEGVIYKQACYSVL